MTTDINHSDTIRFEVVIDLMKFVIHPETAERTLQVLCAGRAMSLSAVQALDLLDFLSERKGELSHLAHPAGTGGTPFGSDA